MLLDRRRIKKWAKWVALALAIIFAASFLFLGVGYGGAGFNLSELFTGGGCSTATTEPQTIDAKIQAYLDTLAQNPNDTTALLALATIYQDNDDYATAAQYLEKVIAADPTQKDVYVRLANLYMRAEVQDYQSAVTVLNKAVSIDSGNADLYLKLGSAQSKLYNYEAAILAWQKYIELDPNGQMVPTVKDQIEKLKKTTTTTGLTTTTTAGSGTASTTTTTSGSTTTTTAK